MGNQTLKSEHNEPPSLKHNGPTPGPWEATFGVSYLDERRQWMVPGVAHCGDGERSQANARLIAAAPDMLAALQLLHDDIAEYASINNLGGFDTHVMRMARAAIAKANGDA